METFPNGGSMPKFALLATGSTIKENRYEMSYVAVSPEATSKGFVTFEHPGIDWTRQNTKPADASSENDTGSTSILLAEYATPVPDVVSGWKVKNSIPFTQPLLAM
jgi:hypothetical protein